MPPPYLWLTDFLLAENLHLAYENEHAERTDQAEPPPDGEQPAAASLSPQVKGYIADEVRRQLKAESEESVQPTASRSAAQTGQVPPPALDPAEQHFAGIQQSQRDSGRWGGAISPPEM